MRTYLSLIGLSAGRLKCCCFFRIVHNALRQISDRQNHLLTGTHFIRILYVSMARSSLNRIRWTLTFDADLKKKVQQAATKLHVYPVQILESIVRDNLNPYGLKSIKDSMAYVNSIRQQSKAKSDQQFIEEIKKWEK